MQSQTDVRSAWEKIIKRNFMLKISACADFPGLNPYKFN